MALQGVTCTAVEGLRPSDGRGKASQMTPVRKERVRGPRDRTLGTVAPATPHTCGDKVGLEAFLYEAISEERFVCGRRLTLSTVYLLVTFKYRDHELP